MRGYAGLFSIRYPEYLSFEPRGVAPGKVFKPRAFRGRGKLVSRERSIAQPESQVRDHVEPEPLAADRVPGSSRVLRKKVVLLHRVHVELYYGRGKVPRYVLRRRKKLVGVMVKRVRFFISLFRKKPFNRQHPSVYFHRRPTGVDSLHLPEALCLLSPVLAEAQGNIP